MEQLYNTQYTISVFMNPNVFKDEGARRQKRWGIRGSYSRLKAVSDVNLTDTQTGMSRKDEEVSFTGGGLTGLCGVSLSTKFLFCITCEDIL